MPGSATEPNRLVSYTPWMLFCLAIFTITAYHSLAPCAASRGGRGACQLVTRGYHLRGRHGPTWRGAPRATPGLRGWQRDLSRVKVTNRRPSGPSTSTGSMTPLPRSSAMPRATCAGDRPVSGDTNAPTPEFSTTASARAVGFSTGAEAPPKPFPARNPTSARNALLVKCRPRCWSDQQKGQPTSD